jgi:D-alanyl-D-alanine carboxypeptidase
VTVSAGAILVVALGLLGGGERSQRVAAEPAADGIPRFHGTTSPLDGETRKRITGSSWRPGCPVGLDDLRLLKLTFVGFDGEAHGGRLIVHEDVDRRVLRAMRSLYRHRFAIRRMRLVDAYGADDHRSMNADNTSAFNCRFIAGQPGVWSQHAYGKAIDINPIENPYVSGGHVSPPAGEPFADRSRNAKGMIHAGDATVRAFSEIGWGWGGSWSAPKDYQHFSSTGT